MKIYLGKSYIEADDIKELINKVLSQIETLETENERLEIENTALRAELLKKGA